MQCYTLTEFMRADFPSPDMQEEYSSFDLVQWDCRQSVSGPPQTMIHFMTETTAKMNQLRIGSGKPGPSGIVGNWRICTFCMVPRDSMGQDDLFSVLDQLHPDAVMLDALVLNPEVRESLLDYVRENGKSVQLGPAQD